VPARPAKETKCPAASGPGLAVFREHGVFQARRTRFAAANASKPAIFNGNVIEFRTGGKQVRIECNKPIVDSDRPVFAIRRQ